MHQLSVVSRLVVTGTGRRMQDAMKVHQFTALGLDFKMLAAGCSVQELKNFGFSLSHWQDAGYDLKWMNEADFSFAELKFLGADLRDMVAAGIDPISLYASYALGELLAAGADVAGIMVSCA
jgi:hypothetical protein